MKAVIFDCDGVLVDSEILYEEIEHNAIADLGLTYDKDEYRARFMGKSGTDWHSGINDDYVQKYDRPLPADFKDRIKADVMKAMTTKLQAIKGIDDLLKNLSAPKAVASSTKLELLKTKLINTKLSEYFGEHIYSSEQVINGKPAPDLFLLAADKLNTAPKDCIVIEDSANGVQAGLAAGMHVIGFCGGGHCDEKHAQTLLDEGAHKVVMSNFELGNLLTSYTPMIKAAQ